MEDIYRIALLAWSWCLAHPEIAIPAVVYVAWNVIPRTPPKNRALFALWSVAERAMLLSWDKWGGRWKLLGIVSPSPETWAAEAPTRRDTPTRPPTVLLCLALASCAAFAPACSLFESACAKSMPVLTAADALAADAATSIARARPEIKRLGDPRALAALRDAESALHVAQQAIALATTSCSKPDVGTLFAAFVNAWSTVRPFLALLGGTGTAQVPDPIVYVRAMGGA